MAQLVVRNLDEDVKRRLRERANQRGRSMEEEVREILLVASLEAAPVAAPLGTRIAHRFAGLGLTAKLPEFHGQMALPAEFSE